MNKYGSGQPGAPVYEYTDVDGETLTISPNGQGTALLETTGMIVIPPAEYPAIMRALVDASGVPIEQIRGHYYSKYSAPRPVSRQDRRKHQRLAKKSGSSFYKESK